MRLQRVKLIVSFFGGNLAPLTNSRLPTVLRATAYYNRPQPNRDRSPVFINYRSIRTGRLDISPVEIMQYLQPAVMAPATCYKNRK
ncbi:hypothetical protein B0H16DRAFT_1556191 [Mycena metata]|uniref:Uncharacterized protein n=1 Tax=Mycena metata TaxID=1033252 RepID=A0AAD7N618_9AGAR|nr:hypothetical protein B0H16DRAFT_1556191 [Mycena metata]